MKTNLIIVVTLLLSSLNANAQSSVAIQCQDNSGNKLWIRGASWKSDAKGFLTLASGVGYPLTCKVTQIDGNDSRSLFDCETSNHQISASLIATPDDGINAYMTGGTWGSVPKPDHSFYCD